MDYPIIGSPVPKQEILYSATHISAFTYANMGDCVLPISLRKLFSDYLGVNKWHNGHIDDIVDNLDIQLMNLDDFIVIGGGGLFDIPTYPEPIKNNLSGWLLKLDVDHLKKINKPVILFAVGYNLFRNQADFAPIFTQNINEFVKKASFVGLRNHGSIEKVKTYLQAQDLKEKLCFQPCMTTLISKLYPNFIEDYNMKEDFIAINCAYDREQFRVDNHLRYMSIAKVAKRLSEFTKIKVYAHKEADKQILEDLNKQKVLYEVVEFRTAEDVIKEYAKPRLVIGMRGHAQMIPFGCHTPILSIISHDKMQYFLDDIHHPAWGVEINDPEFENKLYNKAVYSYAHYKDTINDIANEQEILWQITLCNMHKIKEIVQSPCKQ